MNASSRVARAWSQAAFVVTFAMAHAPLVRAQTTAADSAGRWKMYAQNLARVTAGSFAFAAWDQWRVDPKEWGKGWPGYERRVASEAAGSFVQETITEGLAAALHRPLDYTRCTCLDFKKRFVWAVGGAVTDQMPDGSHPVAVPRIAGSYVGSYVRTTWHPEKTHDRVKRSLISGTSSIGISAAINLAYEFVIRPNLGARIKR